MIDWLTLRLFVACDVPAGRIISITPDGELEWQSPKRLKVRGSHDSSVEVRNFGYDASVEISGNPAKWFQGHNVFGQDDVSAVARRFALDVLARIGYTPTPDELHGIARGNVLVRRVDATHSWDFGNQRRALSVVQGLSQSSRLRHRGMGSMLHEGTVYWRKGSRYLSAKAYAKGLELTKHKLPDELPHRDQLLDFASGLVRFEFTLRAMWLKHEKLDTLHTWDTRGATASTVHAQLMQQLEINDATVVEPGIIEDLPPRFQAIYTAWLSGADIRAMFKSRRTFYRYRAQLLPHGVDIAIRRPHEESNVVPLRITLVGRPVDVPDWARGTPLYFDPIAA